MRNLAKRVLVLILSAVMVFGTVSTAFAATSSPTTAPEHVTSKNVTTYLKRTLNTNANGWCALLKTKDEDKNKTFVTVADQLKITTTGKTSKGATVKSSMTYKVGVIGGKAFDKVKNLKTVKLGKHVYQVNNEAFLTNKNLTKIIITGTGKIKFGKTSLKGLNIKNLKIQVNKKMNKELQRQLKANLHALGFTNKLLASNVSFVAM